MRKMFVVVTVLAAFLNGCGDRGRSERDPGVPVAENKTILPSDNTAIPVKPPIDLGDVDSGIAIRAQLSPESASATVTAEYVETQRNTLSMATITVKEPFPENLLVTFMLTATRDFVERPVVVRARAYRDDVQVTTEDYACVLGKDAKSGAMGPDGQPHPREFSINVLEGLQEVPATMLVHARADAWLMETGTSEEMLDARTASSPDQVPLLSNPVRINFVKSEGTS